MTLFLRFTVRGTRYSRVHLEQDLWSEWLLTQVNGRRGTPLGRARSKREASIEAALLELAAIAKRRRQRGYQLTTQSNQSGTTMNVALPEDAPLVRFMVVHEGSVIRIAQREAAFGEHRRRDRRPPPANRFDLRALRSWLTPGSVTSSRRARPSMSHATRIITQAGQATTGRAAH